MKKTITLRDRRRIYDDAVYVLGQSDKAAKLCVGTAYEKNLRNINENQLIHCESIVKTVLGLEDVVKTDDDGNKVRYVGFDNGALGDSCLIAKSVFTNIVATLPGNKDAREALWDSFIKDNSKARNKLSSLIAAMSI